MTLPATPWGRENEWDPTDPRRHCYSCGASPTSRYSDGSPRYSCGPHSPVVATAEEMANWGGRRWRADAPVIEIGPFRFRVRAGAKAKTDLVLEMETTTGWSRLPMAIMFLQADFFAENEQALKDSGERPDWKFGSVAYLQPRLDRAMQTGWRQVADEVTEQRKRKGT